VALLDALDADLAPAPGPFDAFRPSRFAPTPEDGTAAVRGPGGAGGN